MDERIPLSSYFCFGIRRLIISFVIIFQNIGLTSQLNGFQEICQLETFVASCEANEVIVMESAYFGRMRLGRCVKGNLGYVGCHAKVLHIADRWCSGRHSCEIPIPNELFEQTKPCYNELKSYLEVSYSCVRVATLSNEFCKSCDAAKLPESVGYIASIVSGKTNCGTTRCPWIIEGLEGQRINITILDFSHDYDKHAQKSITSEKSCSKVSDYVFIKEASTTVSMSICGHSQRKRHLYTSKGSRVEIVISVTSERDTWGHYLLRHEKIGCPDKVINNDMWFKRKEDGNEAIIGCKNTEQTWHLVCIGYEWRGDHENCTAGHSARKSNSAWVAIGNWNVAYGTAIIVIILVAIMVGVLILIIGVIGWRWYGRFFFCREVKDSNLPPEQGEIGKAPFSDERCDIYDTYVSHSKDCPVYSQQQDVNHPLFPHDVSLLTHDVNKARILATFCNKDNAHMCKLHNCGHNKNDTYSTTYFRSPTNNIELKNTKYLELEPHL